MFYIIKKHFIQLSTQTVWENNINISGLYFFVKAFFLILHDGIPFIIYYKEIAYYLQIHLHIT